MHCTGRITLAVALVLALGCSGGGTPFNPPTTCSPACTAGFVCVGTSCVAVDAGAADTAVDVAADRPADTAPEDGATTCGYVGRRCCGARRDGCLLGGDCIAGFCRAYTRALGECAYDGDCTMGQVCTGPMEIDGRQSYRCGPPQGTRMLGEPCAMASECATGVCLVGRCSFTCRPDMNGDADCAARAPGYVCTHRPFPGLPIMDMPHATTLGFCIQRCEHERACPTGMACAPAVSTVLDRLVFACFQGNPMRTDTSGAMCMLGTANTSCQAAICIDASMPGMPSRGVCTAPCRNDMDCPSMSAPRCQDIGFELPSGAQQNFRGCQP
ncbi:MAG: hypothetical protein HY909_19605 [Deltaproteobacteria bacterium]|nr:hypothetical protein [Deltaproteobacteria bacterium]